MRKRLCLMLAAMMLVMLVPASAFATADPFDVYTVRTEKVCSSDAQVRSVLQDSVNNWHNTVFYTTYKIKNAETKLFPSIYGNSALFDCGLVRKNGKVVRKYDYHILDANLSKAERSYVLTKTKAAGAAIKKASRRKTAAATQRETAYRTAEYVARTMSYKNVGGKDVYTVMRSGKGQCLHYAVLYYLIGKAAGLNVRYVEGKAAGYQNITHAWCMVQVGEYWYHVDPTWADKGKTVNKKWVLFGMKDAAKNHWLPLKYRKVFRIGSNKI